jgi:hypothetical protein
VAIPVTETREGGRIEGETLYTLGIDADTNREAIEHLMTEGSLYSTIDDLVSFPTQILRAGKLTVQHVKAM